MFFGSLSIMKLKGKGEEVKAKEEHCLMLNLLMEKEAGKDWDKSELSITRPN